MTAPSPARSIFDAAAIVRSVFALPDREPDPITAIVSRVFDELDPDGKPLKEGETT